MYTKTGKSRQQWQCGNDNVAVQRDNTATTWKKKRWPIVSYTGYGCNNCLLLSIDYLILPLFPSPYSLSIYLIYYVLPSGPDVLPPSQNKTCHLLLQQTETWRLAICIWPCFNQRFFFFNSNSFEKMCFEIWNTFWFGPPLCLKRGAFSLWNEW